jgi:hypothetical protein
MDIINYSRLNKDNEILIPKNSIVGKSDSILIRKEDDLTFSIYDLIEYKKILEKIKQESEVALFCGNIKRKEFFDEYIKKLSFSVLDVIRKDSSNKVLIPNHVKDMYDIEDRVLVCDGIDHIKVFKNDENKKEYEKRLINIFK